MERRRTQETLTDTGSGCRAPLAPRGRAFGLLGVILTLIASHLVLLSRRKNAKRSDTKERYRITSVVYIAYTRAAFSHSSQASSLTRTLSQHICMYSLERNEDKLIHSDSLSSGEFSRDAPFLLLKSRSTHHSPTDKLVRSGTLLTCSRPYLLYPHSGH